MIEEEKTLKTPDHEKSVEEYADELVNFLFNSFDYSEGSQQLQSYMIEYLFRTRGGVDHIIPFHLQDKIRGQISQKLMEAAQKRLRKAATADAPHIVEHGGKQLDFKDRQRGVEGVINDLTAAADYGYRSDVQEILQKILTEKISREYKYLVEHKGRPMSEAEPKKDRFRSDLCRFALRGETIPNHVFDDVFNDLFRDLGELLRQQLSEKRGLKEKLSDVMGSSDQSHFKQVIKIYNAHHTQEEKVEI